MQYGISRAIYFRKRSSGENGVRIYGEIICMAVQNRIKIQNITYPELDIYVREREAQLKFRPAHQPGIFIAESPIVIERALDAGYDLRHGLIGAGVYASHGYERSHVDGVKNTYELVKAYITE